MQFAVAWMEDHYCLAFLSHLCRFLDLPSTITQLFQGFSIVVNQVFVAAQEFVFY